MTADAPAGETLLGQPRGLATLFLTEMWERFTYYGMRALLILFLTEKISAGGLGIDVSTASAIYGLYIAGTYLLSPLGGWIADRLVGAQRAVLAGGVLIMGGNALLVSGSPQIFFLGLLVIVCGVGLLKPNISALVGSLYPEGGARLDAGFSIFYMGINTGSFLGSILVPIVAAHYGWHWGFAVPAAGMLLGLVQFVLTRHHLRQAGMQPTGRGSWWPVVIFVGVVGVVAFLMFTGQLTVDPLQAAQGASWLMGLIAIGYFAYLAFFAQLGPLERGRVGVMVALFVGSVLFWAGYEQTGASFNLFAQRYTDRMIGGWEMPAGVLQAVNPLLVILFAPAFAVLWLRLNNRGQDPSAPAKFGAGLVLMGLGFLVMYGATQYVLDGSQVLPTWLIVTYLLHTWGELCLSPVGLSSMSKLAPASFKSQVMGLWVLSMALGSNLAGLLSSQYDGTVASLPGLFLKVCGFGVISGGLMWLATPWLRRLIAGERSSVPSAGTVTP